MIGGNILVWFVNASNEKQNVIFLHRRKIICQHHNKSKSNYLFHIISNYSHCFQGGFIIIFKFHIIYSLYIVIILHIYYLFIIYYSFHIIYNMWLCKTFPNSFIRTRYYYYYYWLFAITFLETLTLLHFFPYMFPIIFRDFISLEIISVKLIFFEARLYKKNFVSFCWCSQKIQSQNEERRCFNKRKCFLRMSHVIWLKITLLHIIFEQGLQLLKVSTFVNE